MSLVALIALLFQFSDMRTGTDVFGRYLLLLGMTERHKHIALEILSASRTCQAVSHRGLSPKPDGREVLHVKSRIT